MTDRTIAEKLRHKPGTAAYVENAPEGVDLGIPEGELAGSPAGAAFILVFASTQAELQERMRAAAPAVGPSTVTWVGYPKGSRAKGLDISRDTIAGFAREVGLIANANFSIDEVWSAIRVRPLKPGE